MREVLGHLDGGGSSPLWQGGVKAEKEGQEPRDSPGKSDQAGRTTGQRHRVRSALGAIGQQRPVWLDCSGERTALGDVSLSC